MNVSTNELVSALLDGDLTVSTSDKGGAKCVCPRSFVCLSVC